MDKLTLDTTQSKVTLRTRAGGFFGALAHDLELTATFARGSATRDGERWDGEAVIEPSAIKVVGVLKKGHLDKSVLSASDVREIERRMVDELGVREIVVRASGSAERPEVRVTAKREATARVKVRTSGEHGFAVTGTISIKGLGLPEVKGPLGAFVIKDDVEVEATAMFSPG